MGITMKKIMAFFSRGQGSNFSGKQVIPAILLFLGCSLVIAESNPPSTADIGLSNELQTKVLDTKDEMPTHIVVAGDTLWNVTKRLRPETMSMAQAMDILYLYNREAFLKGDSTSLIVGSVVRFPLTAVSEEPTELIVLDESAELVIPKIESVVEVSTEIGLDNKPEIEPQVTTELIEIEDSAEIDQPTPIVFDPIQADDDIELDNENIQVEKLNSSFDKGLIADNGEKDNTIQSEQRLNPPTTSSNNVETASENTSIENRNAPDLGFEIRGFYETLSKLKQLPIDFWVFAGALLFALLINRSKKQDRVNNEKQSSSGNTEKPIETVLDGPFAESADDEVFADIAEDPQAANTSFKASVAEPNQAINLPGTEELEAQLREDRAVEQPQANKILEVDFEDESFEIDPLQIKLDMASLCIEMGDIESAQAILEEIIGEADKQGKAKAREILDSIET
jgi:FimV-like protein